MVQYLDEPIPPQRDPCRLSYQTSGHMGGMAHGLAVSKALDSSSIAIYREKSI